MDEKTKENLLIHVERISSEAAKSNLDFSVIKCTSYKSNNKY